MITDHNEYQYLEIMQKAHNGIANDCSKSEVIC